jgi:single-stranded DNA-binding protein
MSLQIATIIGNATKDAEQKVSKDGVNYVSFRIAVSGADNKATFYNILLFGRYGEVLRDSIIKGREIFVSGRLSISEKGYISVIAEHVELLRFPKRKGEEKKEEEKPVDSKKK